VATDRLARKGMTQARPVAKPQEILSSILRR